MTGLTRFNKFQFFADMQYTPHPGQLEVHYCDALRRICVCGVRWGKTRCAAMEGLVGAIEPKPRGSIGWIVAPTYDLADKVFREIVLIAAGHLKHRIISLKESERRLYLRNMAGGTSEIRCRSVDNPTSLLGEGLDWLIVDEAAQIKPAIWQQYLSQRLLDRRGWALFISTPKGKSWFYDLWKRGQGEDPDFKSWNFPSWNNPLLDKELIEKERLLIPESVFRQEYGAEFLEGTGCVFRKIRDYATGSFQEPIPGQTYFGGLDLAKSEDYTVLVIMNEKKEVVFADRFNRQDWGIQISRVKAAAERYNRARILLDSTSIGDPILEAFKKAGVRALGYTFTQASKSDLINRLALDLERARITLPRPEIWPQGIDELERFQYSINDQGGIRSGAPYGYHDDCVIALALANWDTKKSTVRIYFV